MRTAVSGKTTMGRTVVSAAVAMLVVAGVIVMPLACSKAQTHPSAATNPDDAPWLEVLAARRATNESLRTLQAEISEWYFSRATGELPEFDEQWQYTLWTKQKKIYKHGTAIDTNKRLLQIEAAFDGKHAALRNSYHPDRILVGQDVQTLVGPSILPHNLIEDWDPTDIAGFLTAGKFAFVSSEHTTEQGIPTVKVVVSNVRGYRIEISYDSEHGYLPRRTEIYHQGVLETLIDDVTFQEVSDAEGHKFYYPLTGRKSMYEPKGGVATKWRFEVKPDSIRINADIPDEKFSLMGHPDEGVFDIDRQVMLVEPGAAQKGAGQVSVYDEKADAKQQIASALASAKKENRRVLIQWGGNWCGWCIALHNLYKNDPDIALLLHYEYDLVYIDSGGKNLDIAKAYDAHISGFPYLTILDADGKPLVNQATDSLEVKNDKGASIGVSSGYDKAKILAFLKKYVASPRKADDLLALSLTEAKATNRRVFMHFGSPSCGACLKLDAWMARPTIAALLNKDFVEVKIDVARTVGGDEMYEKKFRATGSGIPWFAFLDADGKVIIHSGIAGENIGYPVKPRELERFGLMLKKSSRNLTEADIQELLNSLRPDAKSVGVTTAPVSTK